MALRLGLWPSGGGKLATGDATRSHLPTTHRSQCGCATESLARQGHTTGHWEIAGVPVPFDWGYFPQLFRAISRNT